MQNKYLFSNENHKPVCIQFYDNDEIAIQEALKLSQEKGFPVNVSRLLTQRAADASPVAPECKHVWLYNVKQDWKVCDKCGQRTARKRRAKGDKFDPRDVSILGGDPSL